MKRRQFLRGILAGALLSFESIVPPIQTKLERKKEKIDVYCHIYRAEEDTLPEVPIDSKLLKLDTIFRSYTIGDKVVSFHISDINEKKKLS